MSAASASLPVLVAGGGIGGLAAALALTRQGYAVKVLEQAAQLGEIGAGIQLGPNAFAAFDALGIGEKARGRAVYTDEMVMHDALDETLVGRIPTGEAFRAALRQSLRGHPPRRRAQVAARRRAGVRPHRGADLDHGAARRPGRHRRHRARRERRHASRRRADRRRWRQVGGAPAVRRRRGARLGARGLPRGDRPQGFPRRPAMERRQHLGRPQLPPRPLSAARRRAVQRRRHVSQPGEGGVERARRQPRRGAGLLRGHLRARPPVDRPAQGLEAVGHRRPRADRPMDLRPRHAARRRSAPDAAVSRAGRLHGARGRGDARRGAAHRTAATSRAPSRITSAPASHAPRASCSRRARWAASSTPRASSAWCATNSGRAARRSASTTRWSGSTAGRSRTASRRDRVAPRARSKDHRHE